MTGRTHPFGNRATEDGVFRWLFENRHTGKITIAQRPNWILVGWLAAIGLGWISSSDTIDQIAAVLRFGFAVIWGSTELLSGVNPFRRMLGAAVIIFQVASLFLS